MVRVLSAEQLRALQAFAKANGPRWRLALNDAWMTGRYDRYNGTDDEGSLQQIRNAFGPSWLVTFSFKKATTWRLAYCDGCDVVGLHLKPYAVEHHDGGVSSPTFYCNDCADLARMDWNGETKSITPIKES